jgi:hypothetical protein
MFRFALHIFRVRFSAPNKSRTLHFFNSSRLIDWSQRTALPELLDVRLSKTTKDRLYRVSDELLKHRETIETRLRGKSLDLFSLRRSVILYDVTNTDFEGIRDDLHGGAALSNGPGAVAGAHCQG